MTRTRQLALLVGVVASLAGLGIIAGLPLGLELTDIFLGLVAALAGIQSLRYVQRRRDTAVLTSSTDDPEMRVGVPQPGADIDADIVTAMANRSRWAARNRVVDRLEASAKRTLILRGGLSADDAESALDDGAWTDDRVVARFLGASVSVPIATRLRLLLSGQSALVARVGRTIDAIERIGDDDWQSRADDPPSSTQQADQTGANHR
ncbi:hypothetical protein ACFQJC_13260 [Haloferax namakaokahaiae]|uniref:Uncharacterized protein n=1 Tax=Haloferax namakaokahaiae TaxID=1748331 RepID=A0ABD5ZGQ6_9EURY